MTNLQRTVDRLLSERFGTGLQAHIRAQRDAGWSYERISEALKRDTGVHIAASTLYRWVESWDRVKAA